MQLKTRRPSQKVPGRREARDRTRGHSRHYEDDDLTRRTRLDTSLYDLYDDFRPFLKNRTCNLLAHISIILIYFSIRR